MQRERIRLEFASIWLLDLRVEIVDGTTLDARLPKPFIGMDFRINGRAPPRRPLFPAANPGIRVSGAAVGSGLTSRSFFRAPRCFSVSAANRFVGKPRCPRYLRSVIESGRPVIRSALQWQPRFRLGLAETPRPTVVVGPRFPPFAFKLGPDCGSLSTVAVYGSHPHGSRQELTYCHVAAGFTQFAGQIREFAVDRLPHRRYASIVYRR